MIINEKYRRENRFEPLETYGSTPRMFPIFVIIKKFPENCPLETPLNAPVVRRPLYGKRSAIERFRLNVDASTIRLELDLLLFFLLHRLPTVGGRPPLSRTRPLVTIFRVFYARPDRVFLDRVQQYSSFSFSSPPTTTTTFVPITGGGGGNTTRTLHGESPPGVPTRVDESMKTPRA